MTRLYAGVAAAAAVAFIGFMSWKAVFDRPDDAFAECRQGQVAGGNIGGPFTLVDTAGKTVTEKDVLTKPTLVYFGYTFCSNVCPFDMARNVEAVDLLAEQGLDVTPVFITIDPDRDTVEVLADYAQNLHPALVGLTGSAAQIAKAAAAYKSYYQKQETGDEFYPMDHSTFTYLMLPQTGFAEFYRREVSAPDMAESVACFVQAGKAGS